MTPDCERIPQTNAERDWQNMRFWGVVNEGFAQYHAPRFPGRELLSASRIVPTLATLRFPDWEVD